MSGPVRALQTMRLPPSDAHDLPSSEKRFPDGAHYRIEIPSTEGPAALRAVIEEAERREVLVHRVSQGSGVFMLADEELENMRATAHAAQVEVSLFARPGAGWVNSALAQTSTGAMVGAVARGQDQLLDQLEDIRRAATHGFRSVLIADIGTLSVFAEMRRAGELPRDMQAKISVMLPVGNPATAQVLEQLGANTLNLPTDLTLPQIAAIRQAVDLPLDIYIEAPDNLGGFVRHHELAKIIQVAAPVHIKFGLRNAPDLYPSGSHLEATAVALSRERVRRAKIALELLRRSGCEFVTSALGAAGSAVPTTEGDAPDGSSEC